MKYPFQVPYLTGTFIWQSVLFAGAVFLLSLSTAHAQSADIEVSGCSIAENESVCTTDVTWQSSGTTGSVSVRQNIIQFSTEPQQATPLPRTLLFGNNTFTLHHNGVQLTTASAEASCQAGTVWNGSVCENSDDVPPAPQTPPGPPSAPDCELVAGPNGVVVDFRNERILDIDYWNQNPFHRYRTFFRPVNLPAGRYAVTLMAWDGYTAREEAWQPDERYVMEFHDDESLIATSGSTVDLADNVIEAKWSGQVNDNLIINSDVTRVRARLAVMRPNTSTPNSVNVVCAAFDMLESFDDDDGPSVPDDPIPPACPLPSAADRVIINFGANEWLQSDTNDQRSTAPQPVNIAPGTYRVTLVAWDGYAGRENSEEPHNNQRMVLQFFNSSGAEVAVSSPTSDIPNNVPQATNNNQVVNESLVINQAVTSVRAAHAEPQTVLTSNRFLPICAAIDGDGVGPAAGPASATISAEDCPITAGNSTCNAQVTWSSSNTQPPRRVEQNGIQFSSAESGSEPRPLTQGENTFTFSDESSGELARATATASCVLRTWWNGTECAEPDLSLELESSIIRQGQVADVRWGITNIDGTGTNFTCSIRGAGLDEAFSNIESDRPADEDRTNENPLETPPVMNASEILLSCTEQGSGLEFTATQSIEVIPGVIEI